MRGDGHHIIQSPNNLESAVNFLRSLPPTPHVIIPRRRRRMIKRCCKCHKYVAGAPSEDVDHKGYKPGPNCALPHCPHPCDYQDKDTPCAYWAGEESNHLLDPQDQLIADLSLRGAEGGLVQMAALQQEIDRLRSEKEEESRRAHLSEQANSRLRETTNLLRLQLGGSISTPTTTMTTTMTSVSVLTTPMMGTGRDHFSGLSVQPADKCGQCCTQPRGE